MRGRRRDHFQAAAHVAEALVVISILPIYIAQRFSSDTRRGGGLI
jgi:ABC-type Fe3+ transport system permease subunit